MFKKIKVKIRLTEPMLGTVPKDPEVYKRFIESKKPPEVEEDETETVEKLEERGWTGFHKDEKGIFIYDYMIKGLLKTAGNNLKDVVGIANLRARIEELVFIFPRKIYLGKKEPDGVIERPLRAMTMQGPRITLARSDYVKEGTTISFEIHYLRTAKIRAKLLRHLLEYGRYKGLGQFRGGSYGRFEILEFKEVK